MPSSSLPSFLRGVVEAARVFLAGLQPDPSEQEPPGLPPAPVQRKVQLILYSPRVSSASHQPHQP